MKRGPARGGERFVALHHWMLKSPAWLALSPNGKAVLLHVWERHNGSNNGQIVYAVREAQEIGLSRDQAARALKELVALGFLRVTRASGFTVKTKEARCWSITAEPIDGQPSTRDFMRWTAQKIKTQSHQRDRQSHQRDRDPENETILPVTVAPARLSEAKSTRSQSHQRDTSILPCDTALPADPDTLSSTSRNANWRRPKFGDAAKAERTARVPRERQP